MFAVISVSVLLVVVVVAEPPRANTRFSKEFQQVEGLPSQQIGYNPLGVHFLVLNRLQGVPLAVDSTTQEEQSPNEEEIGNSKNVTEVRTEINKESDSEQFDSDKQQPENEKLSEAKEEGVYYIYHPDGLLQRVTYATNDDVQNMAFSAKLKYENVRPITEPIYTYDPKTFVFKRV